MKLFFFLFIIYSANTAELIHGNLKVKYEVQIATDLNEIFRRTSGWSGADGIFSYCDAATQKTLFVFSDTWVGEVDPVTRQRKSMKMINNSMAVLNEKSAKNAIEFLWDKEGNKSAFIPPQTNIKTWYWLQDGFIHKDTLYNFPMRLVKNDKGAEGFKFKSAGVDVLKIPLKEGHPQIKRYEVIKADLHRDGLFFGAGVLKNAEDGFIYVYGRLHKKFQVELAVSRIKPEKIHDLKAWRFWDGKKWNSDITSSASLGEGGPELSVTKMESGPFKGKFILVSMPISRKVFIRIGDSPIGPFSSKQVIYTTPEINDFKDIYTYNAKAHPALSKESELVISYNVNTVKLENHKNADIYRPRFIKIRFLE